MRRRTLAAVTALVVLASAPEAMADRDFEPRFARTVHGDVRIVGQQAHRLQRGRRGLHRRARRHRGVLQQRPPDDPHGRRRRRGDVQLERRDARAPRRRDRALRRAVLEREPRHGRPPAARRAAGRGPARRRQARPAGGGGYQAVAADVLDAARGRRARLRRVRGHHADRRRGRRGDNTRSRDVQGATGHDAHAGWALVVAFEQPAEPLRNLAVFDG